MTMQALILCGGLGTRLRTEVSDRPKAMAPIQGTPFLELLVRGLARRGIADFVLATGYLGEQIEAHFGDGSAFGVTVRYSREHEPLGTGGAVKLAEPLLAERFFVLNGDTWLDFDPTALVEVLERARARFAMCLRPEEHPERYGSVEVAPDGRVTAFVEKGVSGGRLINAGVYLVRRSALAGMEAGRAVSLEREWLPELLSEGVYSVETDGLFIDIGVPEDFRRAQKLLEAVMPPVSPSSFSASP